MPSLRLIRAFLVTLSLAGAPAVALAQDYNPCVSTGIGAPPPPLPANQERRLTRQSRSNARSVTFGWSTARGPRTAWSPAHPDLAPRLRTARRTLRMVAASVAVASTVAECTVVTGAAVTVMVGRGHDDARLSRRVVRLRGVGDHRGNFRALLSLPVRERRKSRVAHRSHHRASLPRPDR